MNDPVYELGLSRLLDGEMTAAEAEVFATHLRARPELVRDLQQHLALWEVWSQLQSPERSARAFANSWETRLAAENNADAFCREVQVRVTASDATPSLWARAWSAFRSFRPADHRWVTLASAAAALAVFAGVFWVGVAPTAARSVVTIEGDAVCTRCILHETHDCTPAVRVVSRGTTQIYYLNVNTAVKNCHAPFCSKETVRVRATGTASVDNGHLRLDATAMARTP